MTKEKMDMKNKTIMILLAVIIILAIIFGYMFFTGKIIFNKVLTGEKVNSIEQIKILIPKEERKGLKTEPEIVDIANQFLSDYDLMKEPIAGETVGLEYYNNSIASRTEVKVTSKNESMLFDGKTGEIISYNVNKEKYIENTLSKENIKNIADEIFNKFVKNQDLKDYKIKSLEQFNESIWKAAYVKTYNGLENIGESIKFNFEPASGTLLSFTIQTKPYANNKVKISAEKAMKIGEESSKIQSARFSEGLDLTNVSIDLGIVQPNYLFETVEDTSLYKEINQTRRAYIYKVGKTDKLYIYIDCTTGEILGGEIIRSK
jgi:hypothetical protein